MATFLARLPGPGVSWVDEHLLVIAGGSRHNQAEPDGPARPANQPIKDPVLQISAGRVGQAPQRRPGGRAQITPLCPSRSLTTTSGRAPRSAARRAFSLTLLVTQGDAIERSNPSRVWVVPARPVCWRSPSLVGQRAS
jgi:hypothetical protein